MKTCLYTGLLDDRNVRQALDLAAQVGYEAVELGGTYGTHFDPDKLSVDQAKQLVDYAKAHGLEVVAIAQHVLFVEKEDEKFRGRVEFFKRNLDYAAEMGVPMVVTCTGGPWDWWGNPTGLDGEAAFDRAAEALKECAEHAEKVGVTIALEAVFEQVVHDYVSTLRFLGAVDSKNLKVNFDLQHYAVQLLDIPEVIRRFGDLICHNHLKDVRVRPPSGHVVDQFEYPAMGEGDIDWKKYFEALRGIDYQKSLSINIESLMLPPGWSREKMAKHSLDYLRSSLGK